MKSVEQIESFLESIPKFNKNGMDSANFDLSRMVDFCRKMNNPQNNFKSIHVAGTNGKGTVCRMLASVYQEAGYKVGLYISPHLIDFRERFQINSKYVQNHLLIQFFNRFGNYIREKKFTYFEITTAMAFWFFSEENVDIAILEVGLGGRLDATNVVDPMLSVITSIGKDHVDILGKNIEEIAFEKGGIIKRNKPIMIGRLVPSARSVINNIAAEKSAELNTIDDIELEYRDQKIVLNDSEISLMIDAENWKRIDAENIGIIYKIIQLTQDELSVNEKQLIHGIEDVVNRYRKTAVFEKLLPNKKWFFDGAHNVESIQSLTSHITSISPEYNWTVVLSFMKDKLTTEVADIWKNFEQIYIFSMEGNRAATIDHMKLFFPKALVLDTPVKSLIHEFKSELVIFSGSFYFYSIVSNWMGAIVSADQSNPSAR